MTAGTGSTTTVASTLEQIGLGLPGRHDGVLLTGGAVLTLDDSFTIHDPGWVLVHGATIANVGAGDPPAAIRKAAERVVDTTGSVVMPGMVNAHTHLFQTFFRGLADDKSLLDWLHQCIWPGAIHMDAETTQIAALLGMVENLRGGATGILDHQYIHADPEIDSAVLAAAEQVGVRYLLARGWADRNYEPTLSEPVDTVLARFNDLHQQWDGVDDGRLRVENGPLIPWGCSDDAMRATIQQAAKLGVGMHIHCAETKAEVEMSLEERALRHVPWLASLDALGPYTQLAHGVWLDDSEIDTIARSGAVVVHCPVSNMYLASGVPRILDMIERGVTVALASDGPGSNNRQDMFEVLKATALLQKVDRLDPVAIQPEQVLRMACQGGAAALRQPPTADRPMTAHQMGVAEGRFGEPPDPDHRLGEVTPGARADLLVVKLASVFTTPVHRIPSALVFSAPAAAVSHVFVDGRVLIDQGELTMVDEAALLAVATKTASEVFRRAQIETRLTR